MQCRTFPLLPHLNEDGSLESWDAYVESACFSAHVYLKDPADKALFSRVEKLLVRWLNEHTYGIGNVYTTEEAKARFGRYGDFSFVLETDNYTSFGDKYTRPLVTGADNGDYRKGRATHGFLPSKGPRPVFYCKGPAFREGGSGRPSVYGLSHKRERSVRRTA